MGSFSGIYYWVRLGILVLVSLFAVIAAVRMMRARKFSAGRGIAVIVFELVALVGMWLVVGSSPSPVWFVALLAVGGMLGFLVGRVSKPSGEALRRSPLGAAVNAIAFIFAAMTLLFGSSYLFAIALLGLGLGAGLLIGQFGGEVMAAKSVVAPPAMPAPPMPTPTAVAPPPMPVAAPAPVAAPVPPMPAPVAEPAPPPLPTEAPPQPMPGGPEVPPQG